MNRLARSPMLALPGLLFVAITHTIPALGPAAEAAGGQQPLQLDPARAALMKAHYHEAIAVQDAIIRGDLAAATSAVEALSKAPAPEGLPAAAVPYANALKAAACLRPALPVPSPSAVGGVVGHMVAHQRAIDQMQQGLVLPSAQLWREGAQGLRVAPLRRAELPRNSGLTRDVIAAEERVHRMAEEAVATTEPAVRARQYAQILATCAECHSAHRKVLGPSGVRPPHP